MTPEGSGRLLRVYKVCEGCEGLVALRRGICPHCHAYRFSIDPERILKAFRATGDQHPL